MFYDEFACRGRVARCREGASLGRRDVRRDKILCLKLDASGGRGRHELPNVPHRDNPSRAPVSFWPGPVPYPSAMNACDFSDLGRATQGGDDRSCWFHPAKVASIATISKREVAIIAKDHCSENRYA